MVRSIKADFLDSLELTTSHWQSDSGYTLREWEEGLHVAYGPEKPHNVTHRDAAIILGVPTRDRAKRTPVTPGERLQDFGTFRVVTFRELRVLGYQMRRVCGRNIVQKVPEYWVDNETGEIMSKEDLREKGIRVPHSRAVFERMLVVAGRLEGLPDKDKRGRIVKGNANKRRFIAFILKHRNTRGGLVGGLDFLVGCWIKREYPGTTEHRNVERVRKDLLNVLTKHRIMKSRDTLYQDLQWRIQPRPGLKPGDIADIEPPMWSANNPVPGRGSLDCVPPLTCRQGNPHVDPVWKPLPNRPIPKRLQMLTGDIESQDWYSRCTPGGEVAWGAVWLHLYGDVPPWARLPESDAMRQILEVDFV
jgi:hypothetical protein